MNESFYYREELAERERERERQRAQMEQPPTEVPASTPAPIEDTPAAELEIAETLPVMEPADAEPTEAELIDTEPTNTELGEAEPIVPLADAEVVSEISDFADPFAPVIKDTTPEEATIPTDHNQAAVSPEQLPLAATETPTDPRLTAVPPAVPAIQSAVTLHVVVALEDDEPFSALLPIVKVPTAR